MNYPTAIVVAAGIVAGALLLNGQGASQTSAGSYAIAPDTPEATAWRVNTTNGQVSWCKRGGGGDIAAQPSCSPWGGTQTSAVPTTPKGVGVKEKK